MLLECFQEPLFLFNRTRPIWPAWTRTRHALAAEMSWLTGAVSGAETVNDAATEPRTEYPPRWGRMSRWVRGRAGWRCELCGVKNRRPPNVLTVHHLDHNKWNLAALGYGFGPRSVHSFSAKTLLAFSKSVPHAGFTVTIISSSWKSKSMSM